MRLPRFWNGTSVYRVVAVLLVGAAVCATPVPPDYPVFFSALFVTNVLPPSGLPAPGERALSGMLSYSWPQRRQRIDHEAGSYECVRFYSTTNACALVFTDTSLFALLLDGHGGLASCCRDPAGVGTVAPDWAHNATFMGEERMGKHDAFHWKLTHNFWTDSVTGMPVRFGFPGKANGTQDMWFDTSSIRIEPQAPELFVIPPECALQTC